jgi:hypothetical protein
MADAIAEKSGEKNHAKRTGSRTNKECPSQEIVGRAESTNPPKPANALTIQAAVTFVFI